jgi:hypothetical protein
MSHMALDNIESAMVRSLLSKANIRSVATQLTALLTGRWVMVNGSGLAVLPSAGFLNSYFVCEGMRRHTGTPTDFGNAGAGYASTVYENLPAPQASGQVALGYGIFRAEVGPEGTDPEDAVTVVGDLLKVDIYGRLVRGGNSTDAVAYCEGVLRDTGGKITKLTFRAR